MADSMAKRWRGRAAAQKPMQGAAGFFVAFAGIALLATGAVAVFVSDNTTGTAALVAAGLALVVIATFGDRIESLEGAGLKLQLAAASQFAAATEAEAAGDVDKAARLRADGRALLETARSIASEYSTIRATEESGWERTARMDDLVRQASPLAKGASPTAVRQLFDSGDEGSRVVALGMMATDPALADIDAIQDAIRFSKSAFEQFHALRAAEALAHRHPETPGLDAIRAAVEEALASRRLGKDASRRHVAQQFLSRLQP